MTAKKTRIAANIHEFHENIDYFPGILKPHPAPVRFIQGIFRIIQMIVENLPKNAYYLKVHGFSCSGKHSADIVFKQKAVLPGIVYIDICKPADFQCINIENRCYSTGLQDRTIVPDRKELMYD